MLCRSRRPRGLRCGCAIARLPGIVGLNPAGGMDVCILWAFTFIFTLNLSCGFGKNCFVMAAFAQFSHSFCHFCVASCISLYSVLFGILLKETVVSLLHAAAFACSNNYHFVQRSCFPVPTAQQLYPIGTFHLLFSMMDTLRPPEVHR